MGGSAKPPQETDEQKENERLSRELMLEQLKQARMPAKVPDLKLPPPTPPPPPPVSQSAADEVEAAREAREQAARRINSARGTLFAGETGGYKAKTLLG